MLSTSTEAYAPSPGPDASGLAEVQRVYPTLWELGRGLGSLKPDLSFSPGARYHGTNLTTERPEPETDRDRTKRQALCVHLSLSGKAPLDRLCLCKIVGALLLYNTLTAHQHASCLTSDERHVPSLFTVQKARKHPGPNMRGPHRLTYHTRHGPRTTRGPVTPCSRGVHERMTCLKEPTNGRPCS